VSHFCTVPVRAAARMLWWRQRAVRVGVGLCLWSARRVFSRLHDLGPDAEITVARQDGSEAVFRVTRVKEYPKDEFPTDVVCGDLDHAGLRLISCYDYNIVAFADLVATRPASPA
jgi:Sortase domain